METIKTNRRGNAWEDKEIQCENGRKIHWTCQILEDSCRKVHAVSLERKDCSTSTESWGLVKAHVVYKMPFTYIAISLQLRVWSLTNWHWETSLPALKHTGSQRLTQAINPWMAGSVSGSSFLFPQHLL